MLIGKHAAAGIWAKLATVFIVAAACALSEVDADAISQTPPVPGPDDGGGQGAKNIERWEHAHADGGIPRKPESQGPDSTAWSNTVGICSMIQDENATDVREWVLYYRCESAWPVISTRCSLIRTTPTPTTEHSVTLCSRRAAVPLVDHQPVVCSSLSLAWRDHRLHDVTCDVFSSVLSRF